MFRAAKINLSFYFIHFCTKHLLRVFMQGEEQGILLPAMSPLPRTKVLLRGTCQVDVLLRGIRRGGKEVRRREEKGGFFTLYESGVSFYCINSLPL